MRRFFVLPTVVLWSVALSTACSGSDQAAETSDHESAELSVVSFDDSVDPSNDEQSVLISEAAPLPLLTREDFLNISIPSICKHPAGTLEDGVLELVATDDGDPGYMELGDVTAGQLDNDSDYEYVVTFECSHGGVSWPTWTALYDGDQTFVTQFTMGDLFEAGPWRGGVGYTWEGNSGVFVGDGYYEIDGNQAGRSTWIVIEGLSCVVSWDPEYYTITTYSPVGDLSCSNGNDGAAYETIALEALPDLAQETSTDVTYDEYESSTFGLDVSAGDASTYDSSGGLQPGTPNPTAIACESAQEVFRKYLLAAGDRDYSSAWSFLAQSDKDDYGSFQRFANFWDTVSLVGIKSEQPLNSSTDFASTEYIMFYDIDTGRQLERVQVDTTCTGGVSKIADYRFIEIVG